MNRILYNLLCYFYGILVLFVSNPQSPFLLNVGFIVSQSAGFSREFTFDLEQVSLPPDLPLQNLLGTCKVTRTPQGLLVQANMQAELTLECARCLTDYPQLLKIEFAELYAFSQRSVTDSGLIMPESGRIDLEPLVREYMLLEIPINPQCRPDCAGLCPICGKYLNEKPHTHYDEPGDPRLAELISLLDE
jgi:uncharacterized protein